MKPRPLGRSGLSAPPLAFGGNVFGWTVGEAESFRLLDAFTDAGFSLVDTADVYSRWAPGNKGGESETVLGRWLKKSGKRGRVLIATKLGMDLGDGKKGLSKAWMVRAVEDSLRRLQTDRIDLYQAHVDDETTPLEETLEGFAALVKAGKVRAIGASNYSAARLATALDASARLGLPRYETLQPHYNLYTRAEFEAELEPLCRARGLAVIPYFPLASGFLTGKYRSEKDLAGRTRGDRVKQFLNPRGLRILAALDAVSARLGTKPATVALAWLMSRPTVAAPIASATSLGQLAELTAAAGLSLDADALSALDRASAI